MSEWQPIDTAPRDGTKILAWGPIGAMVHGNRVVSDPVAHVLLFKIAKGFDPAGDWWSPSLPTNEHFHQLAHFPTHWIPIPSPPQTEAGEK